jgi:hypothetical protein
LTGIKLNNRYSSTYVICLLTTKVGDSLEVYLVDLGCEAKTAETLVKVSLKRVATYDCQRLGIATQAIL